jgi:hypothetical protein
VSRQTWMVVGSVVVLCALVSAGPTLIRLAHAAVPLVIAIGVVVLLARLVWYFTRRY